VTIILPKELEALINEKIQNGAYRNPEEIIRASLLLLEAQEKGLDALRAEIVRGVEDIEQGRFITCGTDAELRDFAGNTIERAEKESGSLGPH
jgi:putative addiction module CopG family antidote